MNGKRILIAEDDESILLMEKHILETAGYKVDCARDGKTALEMVQQNHYSLVVADVMMPGLDGFDLTREIEKLYHKTVPVLLVTAVPDALKAAHKRDAKPMSTLQKPFTQTALLTAVRMLEFQSSKTVKTSRPISQRNKPIEKPQKKGWLEKLLNSGK
jgi:DNA-binding response OmpR family regulator